MVRYARQRKGSYLCASVLLLNALKFTGRKVSWKENEKYLKTLVKHKPSWGAPPERVETAFRKVLKKETGRLTIKPTLRYIDNALKNNKAVALRFIHGTAKIRSGHYILIVDRTGDDYSVVNFGGGYDTVMPLSRRNMKACLRLTFNKRNRNNYKKQYKKKHKYRQAIAWAISKRKENDKHHWRHRGRV